MNEKRIGLPTMMSICIGLVIVQGAMLAAIQGIGIGGMGFIAAIIMAFLLAQANAMSFAELSLMLPQEDTLAAYTQKAIGHLPAIVSVFAGYVVVAVLAIPVEMFLVDAILNQLLPGVFPQKVVPIGILLLFSITNLIGMDVFARVQNILVVIMVSALALVGVCSITGVIEPHPILTGVTVDWSFGRVLDGSFFGLVALAMWLLVGVEYICPMVNEVKTPNKNIPRAMHLSLLMIVLIFLAFAYGASLYLNVDTLVGAQLGYLDYINAVFGRSGLIIAIVMALTATCSTVNTILASIPRMLHGMAMKGQFFPQFKVLNRFDEPWVGVVAIALCCCVSFFAFDSDQVIVLVIAASTSWLFAYIVAHIDVIVLRNRFPHLHRPYKTRFYPIPQLFGIIGMGYVALDNSPSPEMTIQVYSITGGILITAIAIGIFWIKFYMKRDLFGSEMN